MSARQTLANRHNAMMRHHGVNHPQTIAAAQEHATAAIQEVIENALASAPRLTDDQAERLAALLRGSD